MNEIKLNGESKDMVQDNVSKLKEIFPEIVTEDKIDFDKLKLILGNNIDENPEKYNFTWPGKTQAIRESQKQSNGTLRPCKEESKNWDSTENLYIEGDNLEVLKLLQKSYYGKIKCIYIDPPYNTGNDFIYSDNYKDNLENYLKLTGQIVEEGERESIGIKLSTNPETAGRYHSNWLNMMYPRLKLARNLLKDDGFIFISIDDNEQENLKKVCEEIFGEENFIASLIRQTRKGGGSMSKYISSDHDYILVFCKNISKLNRFYIPYDKNYIKRYKEEDSKGKFFWDTFARNRQGSSNSYVITAPDGEKLINSWIYKEDKFKKLLDEDEIRFKKLNNGWSVQVKQRINNQGQIMRSLINDFTNEYGTKVINELLGKEIFSYVKPVELIKHLIFTIEENDEIILDFFSGSATTAHSVIEFNNDNKTNHRFIMVQIPEETDEKSKAFNAGYKNICEIGKERIRRTGDNIVEESGNQDLDIGFKVFKLDSSNLEKWDPDYNNIQSSLTIDNIKKDRTNEDLVYEIMLKYGIDLTYPIQQENNIYSIGFGALVICLDNNITKDITNDILKFTNDSSTSRVVFKDSGFKSDANKTNIKEILRNKNINEFITI